jgi:Phosphotransferase enzyme family
VTWLENPTAAMARLHAIAITEVSAEIPAWPRLPDRWTPDGLPPPLGSAAAEVIADLRRRARVARRAFCHGDFYLGNLLFTDEVLTGIVDWERAKVMPAGNEVARFRMDLAIHPGGDAPGVFLQAYLKETAAAAVEDLALWDVLAGAAGLAGADRSRQGLEEIGVSLDTVTVARRATGFLENALARCGHHVGSTARGGPGEPSPQRSHDANGAAPSARHMLRPGVEADGRTRERTICAPWRPRTLAASSVTAATPDCLDVLSRLSPPTGSSRRLART